MKRSTVKIIVFFILGSLFTAGLLSEAMAEPNYIKPEGKVVLATYQNTFEMRKVLDPHSAYGAGTCRTIINMVFDGLFAKDEKGAFQPALAESYDIAKDWSSITLKLRKGVTFHNGDAFSAQDVKFSLERAMREDLRFVYGAELRKNVASIDVLDPYTVRVNLKQPYPGFMDRNASAIAIIPKNYTEKVGDDGFAAKPVGAGPFKVVSFERDVSLDVEAVAGHYRKTPYVKHIRLLTVAEHSTRLAMLKRGEVDFAMASASQIPTLKRDPDIHFFWSKSTFLLSLVFHDLAHPEDSPFKNPLVRQATSLAIDRQGIADAIGNGLITPWGSYLAPYHPGFDPKYNKPDPYDPEKARKLLKQAGYPNGFDTVLVYQPTQKDRFEAIQPLLAEVGIRCKLNMLEGGTWSAAFVAAKHRGIGYGSGPWWAGNGHPSTALGGHITGSWSHKLATPEIKEAMAAVEQAGVDELPAASHHLDEVIKASMIRTPLWSVNSPFAVRKRIAKFPGVPGSVFPVGLEYLELAN